jgi:hopanoid C-3 methylase
MKSLKILLVRPHPYLPTSQWLQSMIRLEPYAQELIAGAVEEPHDVQICDLAVSKKPVAAFRSKLAEYKPDFVGFGGFSSQFRVNKDLAKIVRELLPDAVICLGGIHPSSMPTDCKYPELFDLLVRGDGVSAIKEIIKAMEMGLPLPESDWIIPTASPNFDELAIKPPPAIHSDGITTKPRRDLVNMADYFCICYGQAGERLKTLFPAIACVRTSVGCPSRCSFCVVHFLANGKYLQRSAESVVDEIASLDQEYVYFVDDETFINTKRMQRIAELLIERGVKKKYISWARSDTICSHPELFALWKRAGLEFVYIGFESLKRENLSDYNKNATPEQNRNAREILRGLGLNIHAALMVNPDFEEEDFLTVQKAIKEMAPAEFAFTVLSPPPGTQSFNESRESFICEDPCYYYDCIHTILPTKLPLRRFYKYFAILYAMGAARIPARVNKVKMPLRDHVRFVAAGFRFGRQLMTMHKRYDRKHW